MQYFHAGVAEQAQAVGTEYLAGEGGGLGIEPAALVEDADNFLSPDAEDNGRRYGEKGHKAHGGCEVAGNFMVPLGIALQAHARDRGEHDHTDSHAEEGHGELPEVESAGKGGNGSAGEVECESGVDKDVGLGDTGGDHTGHHKQPHAAGCGVGDKQFTGLQLQPQVPAGAVPLAAQGGQLHKQLGQAAQHHGDGKTVESIGPKVGVYQPAHQAADGNGGEVERGTGEIGQAEDAEDIERAHAEGRE